MLSSDKKEVPYGDSLNIVTDTSMHQSHIYLATYRYNNNNNNTHISIPP